jgi:hypothetical protein
LSENSDIVHALDQIAGVKFMGINARELIGLSLIFAAATPYLREALRFIGVSDVRFALIGPTVGPGVGRGGPSASRLSRFTEGWIVQPRTGLNSGSGLPTGTTALLERPVFL